MKKLKTHLKNKTKTKTAKTETNKPQKIVQQ